MTSADRHSLGYRQVDGDPNVDVLLATMDATGVWDATRRLRAWERQQLCLDRGQRLLDVGCGLGDAALALGDDLGADGDVLGVDTSVEMTVAAAARARAAKRGARFLVGDALALAHPSDAFDVVRSERTLQWLSDPAAAVREMARVVRPNGRIALIDTDWSTFAIDVGDDDIARRIRTATQTERRRPSNVGGRLADLVRSAGLAVVADTEAIQVWRDWNPDETAAPDGCFSMSSLANDLVDAGQLDAADRQRFVATIHDAARDSRFSMSLTMFAVIALAVSRP